VITEAMALVTEAMARITEAMARRESASHGKTRGYEKVDPLLVLLVLLGAPAAG
jgi:hypothetical protein